MNSEEEVPDIFEDSELRKLKIKTSDIPGSGMGLFATKLIEKGQFILQYYGVIIPTRYSNQEPFLMEDKMVYINSQHSVISRGPASRANDIVQWDPAKFCSNQNRQNRYYKTIQTLQGKSRNASIKLTEKDKAFLIADKNIQAGQEIYIDYGFEYWKFFMEKANEANTKIV